VLRESGKREIHTTIPKKGSPVTGEKKGSQRRGNNTIACHKCSKGECLAVGEAL